VSVKRRAKTGRRPLRLSAGDWQRAVAELGFSPQQAKVVGLLLEGKQDKQIAAAMKLRVSTLRTYFSRIFERTGATDRVGLVLQVFQCVYDARRTKAPVIKNDDTENDGLLRVRRSRH
jgi:DNA-binding NarL/FixJ family response regulator